jgi:hypothetical protein
MVLGDGRHKLPVKGDILKTIGKKPGDRVSVLLEERIEPDAARPQQRVSQ